MSDTLRGVSVEIEKGRTLLPLVPLWHPFRPCVLAALASALYYRFLLSRQEHDLLAVIPLLAEALLIPLDPAAIPFFHTIRMFYKLACSLAHRFALHHNVEDLEHALKYYRYILTLPPRAFDEIDPREVADNLTRLLAQRIQTGAVTEVQSDVVEEMVRTLRMAAATDPSSEHIGSIATSAASVLVARLSQFEKRSESEHILELFGEIEKVCPAERSPEICVCHGIALAMCFQQTSQYDHCRRAAVQFNKALALLPSDHVLRPLAQLGIATVMHHRFTHDKNPTSLEEAIHHSRAALDTCPPGHPIRSVCLALLSASLKWRHAFFGNAEFLREADSYSQEALSQELPESLRVPVANVIDESKAFIGGFQRDDSLEAVAEEIRLQRERLAGIPMDHSDQLDALRTLALTCGAKFRFTRATADIEEEIHYHTLALAASPPDHYIHRMSLFSLGKAFQKRSFLHDYDHETDVRYIEQSIRCCRDALELCPRGQMSRFEPLQTLALSLSVRSSLLLQEADFEESMVLFQSALDEEYAHPHARFEIAGQWATCARVHRHPLTALAYEKAISLMQGSLTVGPTLEVQHRLRGRWGGNLSAIPLDYASYHIEIGSLERAVEILEQGRALLWSEMRGLRTPMDQLRASEHAILAERFATISSELENIATSAQPSPETRSADAPGSGELDAFGQVMENVRRLERERGEIIDQIRRLPGFGDFLKAVPFETLQMAAAYGPVVIINHCLFRSDILIVLNDSAPVLIPTAEHFYARTIALKESLLETRTKYSLDSDCYRDVLRDVLQELHELVGRPVIEELQKLGIPEQSRVWWCPTSVLCSLPLHAAGPVEPEDGGATRYFSDIYIPSYTPTLSALIEARKGIADTHEPPSLLIVGQPDLSLPGVRGEIKAIQRLAPSASSLIGAKATRASVMKHLPKHRMAHFACHGTLNPERPFDTAFLFREGERLTLLDIVRSRLGTAEFAFLAVCHAAEWTDANTPDEALHLTAAMQYCGFRSAVGTLWAMADIDGREVSEHFYGHMFAEAEQGVRIGDRSAVALRDAVQRLRRKGVTFERWVNFVHYGA